MHKSNFDLPLPSAVANDQKPDGVRALRRSESGRGFRLRRSCLVELKRECSCGFFVTAGAFDPGIAKAFIDRAIHEHIQSANAEESQATLDSSEERQTKKAEAS
jgi:hypothetical protein